MLGPVVEDLTTLEEAIVAFWLLEEELSAADASRCLREEDDLMLETD